MEEKADEQLADLRKKDVQDQQAFDLLEQGITSEIEHTQEKLATATKTKATSEQALAQAQEDLGATKKTKAEDLKYSQTLKLTCEWETRQKSAKGELGAIDKAIEILQKGVVALVQTGHSSHLLQVVAGHQKGEEDRKARAA